MQQCKESNAAGFSQFELTRGHASNRGTLRFAGVWVVSNRWSGLWDETTRAPCGTGRRPPLKLDGQTGREERQLIWLERGNSPRPKVFRFGGLAMFWTMERAGKTT